MIPAALREKLVLNGCRAIRDQAFDPYPVVKIFAPNGYATWLLTETDPAAQIVHMAFATSGSDPRNWVMSAYSNWRAIVAGSDCRSNATVIFTRGNRFWSTQRRPVSSEGSSPDVRTPPRPATRACRARWRRQAGDPDGRRIRGTP